ncbi:MAG: efflux RND transporter periplasmic adaptor subunit [Deltaproteobacteria bacterium]|nr:efflux RND transporter periplasmic adaptor subunit [Deltaproteobacteria bacterium]
MLQKHCLSITLFSILIFLAGCGDKIEPGTTKRANKKVVKVSVAVVREVKQPFIYEAVGTVEARTSSTLSSKLMGTITSVHVREGDVVKSGDLLVVIDKRQVTAELRKAEATFAEAKRAEASARSAQASAKAGFEFAKATYNRYLKLREEESASRQEFDKNEARYRQAEASFSQAVAMVDAARHRVQQAQAAVAVATVEKKDAWVRAPYDGKVTAKMIDVGDLASPGTPLINLEKQGVYCVVFVLPEKHFPSVYLKQKVKVKTPSLQEKTLEGVIDRIDPSTDRKSRSFRVRAMLPEDNAVRSGMFAKVEIPVGEVGKLMIPSTAVKYEGQLTGIYLIDAYQIAHFRLIRVGKTFGDKIEVVSGLKDGDAYIVIPPPDMEDGAKVEMVS